jgi:hypothetical protein
VSGKYDDRLADYVDVKERIRLFYERHPDGRLTTDHVEVLTDPDGNQRVMVKALAYRSPDDPVPGAGHSWMALPGSTPYTRGSEVENTETSAWGRAIGALGIGIDKSIASGDEVRAKAGEDKATPSTTTHDGGLIGTVARGKPPVDMQLRQTPEGSAWGFKLAQGRSGIQALAIGVLADVLSRAGLPEGERVTVWGTVALIPWAKDGKDMPPYRRINIERIQTSEWTLPASDSGATPPGMEVPEGSAEAPSAELPWDAEASARLDAESAA